jgi:selenide,water dikinase
MSLAGASVKPEDVLVSEETGDDAAVYRMADGTGLVATVDVFTPIVDDPGTWGAIAAANALSDVYAMGGTPRLALNVAGWPVDEVPVEVLADVLRGAKEKAAEAEVAIVGGHTITTATEPIFGLVALGFVDPAKMFRNDAARPGMKLFLTKPLGTGIVTTAIKRGVASGAAAAAAISTMLELNAAAAAAATDAGVTAATDITGFGLLGHLRKMLEASGCAAVLDASVVPLMPDVLDLARRDVVPGGTKRNHAWLQPTTDWGELTGPEQMILADAQTSGGLLLATEHPDDLARALELRGLPVTAIGDAVEGEPGRISVASRIG